MGESIAIVSGKGGVGKTFISINLSYMLSNVFNKKVLLIDGNITTPNVGINLGMTNYLYTIHDVLSGRISARDAIIDSRYGFSVIVGSLNLSDLSNINIDAWKNVIGELNGLYDYIIIDSSAGIGKEVYSVLDSVNNSIIVTTPDKSSLLDSFRVTKLSEYLNVHVLGVILNRYSKMSIIKPSFVEKFIGYPILAVIPEDGNVRESLNKGVPYTHLYQDSGVYRSFLDLSSKITGEKISVVPEKKRGFFDRLLRIFSK